MKQHENWLLEIIADPSNDPLRQFLRLMLFLLSLVYRVAVGIRNWAYDHRLLPVNQVDAPVIAVGNLTVGGTGKTPIVKWLIEQLSENHNVAVVSRGYRKLPGELNDEGLEIARQFPNVLQIQDKDRVVAANQAIQSFRNHAQQQLAILVDDGFQHRRLHRDLNILIVDATAPFGHGYLLPRGLLREPTTSAKRADAVILTRANLISSEQKDSIESQLRQATPAVLWAESHLVCQGWISNTRSTLPLDALRSSKLFSFCGIGNPKGFRLTLENANLNIEHMLPFPDHHHYSHQDIDDIVSAAKLNHCEAIVCTVKDLVKLPKDRDFDVPIYALETKTQMVGGSEGLIKMIAETMDRS